jgi:glyceraldehyde 3-phosphate dehydrogenase
VVSDVPTVAVNGLGRIGRAALKILLDDNRLDLVAVNDVVDVDNLAYLIRYDTVYGRYHREVNVVEDALVVGDKRISAFSERDPANLPWGELGVELVLESPVSTDGLGDRPHRGARSQPPGRPTAADLLRELHDQLHHAP